MESYADCPVKPSFMPAPASFVLVLPKTIRLIESNVSDTEKILSVLAQKEEFSRKQIEGIIGSSKFTAIRALNELISAKKIYKTGSGPAVRYRLSE